MRQDEIIEDAAEGGVVLVGLLGRLVERYLYFEGLMGTGPV
jgi:hypothetical protein